MQNSFFSYLFTFDLTPCTQDRFLAYNRKERVLVMIFYTISCNEKRCPTQTTVMEHFTLEIERTIKIFFWKYLEEMAGTHW